jgi:hypothetical protein
MKTSIVALVLASSLACGGGGGTGPDADVAAADSGAGAEGAAPRGGEATPFAGYTLFHPLRSTSVYLVDMEGELVHQWKTEYNTGQSVYMLDNGHLLRAARDPDPSGPYRGGGEGGIVQQIAFDGTVVWELKFSDEDKRHHHDIEPLPNGNVLLIAWENRTYEEAVAAGINPERMRDDYIWPDFVVEVEPVRPDGANVVWEWHAWDHLVQELYPDRDNYGIVADHPELIDINAAPSHRERQQIATPESIEQLRSLGYIAGNAATDDRPEIRADWMHTNSIDYNPELDQILLSSRHFSEIWVIDHGTTTEEAAGHEGGRWGKGGDLLYRWGNPEAHGMGGPEDRQLFVQHDARWIEPGLAGAGNILIFNNDGGRPEGDFSSVVEIAPPRDADGAYAMLPGEPVGPAEPVWEYTAPERERFFAGLLSSARRLPNGNTLIAEGTAGRIFEVGAGDAIVWEYTNPYVEDEDRQSSRRAAQAMGGDAPGDPGGARGERGAASGERGGERGQPGDRGGDPGQGGGNRAGGRGDGGRGGGPRSGSIYRATRIPPDHPGLVALLAAIAGGR